VRRRIVAFEAGNSFDLPAHRFYLLSARTLGLLRFTSISPLAFGDSLCSRIVRSAVPARESRNNVSRRHVGCSQEYSVVPASSSQVYGGAPIQLAYQMPTNKNKKVNRKRLARFSCVWLVAARDSRKSRRWNGQKRCWAWPRPLNNAVMMYRRGVRFCTKVDNCKRRWAWPGLAPEM
jgi:hypothetical protein